MDCDLECDLDAVKEMEMSLPIMVIYTLFVILTGDQSREVANSRSLGHHLTDVVEAYTCGSSFW